MDRSIQTAVTVVQLAVIPFPAGQRCFDLRACFKTDADAANIGTDDAEFDLNRCADKELSFNRELRFRGRLCGGICKARSLRIGQPCRPSQACIHADGGRELHDEVRLDLDVDHTTDRNDDRHKGQRNFAKLEFVFQLALNRHHILLRKADIRIRFGNIVFQLRSDRKVQAKVELCAGFITFYLLVERK